MRFNNRNAQGLYYYLFWIYLGASIFSFLMAVILLVIFYLTGYRESVSLFNLFFLLILLLCAFYFRMNAMHYHRILIENENQGKTIEDSMKFFSGSNLRQRFSSDGNKSQRRKRENTQPQSNNGKRKKDRG